MVHHHILQQIKRAKQHEGFIHPYYGTYSIAEVPASIKLWLGLAPSDRPVLPFAAAHNQGWKQVIFFFIDGLGFDHFVDYEELFPFFNRLRRFGDVYPLTSTFPSTTPAALTTFHTNKTPQEHGLPEWTVYFEEVDRIIETLPFRTHLSGEREELIHSGGTADMLYLGETFYEELAREEVQSFVFVPAEYADSTYSTHAHRGARTVPFESHDELGSKLIEALRSRRERSYFFANWSAVDTAEHAFGPRSREHLEALAYTSAFLDELAGRLTPDDVRDTLLVVCSDHGQAAIRNEDIIYLNDYLELEANYLKSRNEKTIYPTGAPHDVFLHIYGPRREETIAYLKRMLEGKAEVLAIEEALALGLFGVGTPSDRFLRRVGDVLILPYEGYHVWFKHAPELTFGQRGIHGGLTQREMIVPLAVAPLARLLPGAAGQP